MSEQDENNILVLLSFLESWFLVLWSTDLGSLTQAITWVKIKILLQGASHLELRIIDDARFVHDREIWDMQAVTESNYEERRFTEHFWLG